MTEAAERQAFDLYLRTGRRLAPGRPGASSSSVQFKHNPNHDPRNGRFTSAPGGNGTWTGGSFTGSGGGSFGGAGASATEPWPTERQARSSKSPTHPGVAATGKLSAPATSTADPARSVTKNGYTYGIDAAGRTTTVTGTLTLAPGTRSRNAQATAGGGDRLPTDDGGHYVAVRFNGPSDKFNHFAQDANFNRGDYRALENRWAGDIKQGKQVYVAIRPIYSGLSRRPDLISVKYYVNGRPGHRNFSNRSKGTARGH